MLCFVCCLRDDSLIVLLHPNKMYQDVQKNLHTRTKLLQHSSKRSNRSFLEWNVPFFVMLGDSISCSCVGKQK